MLKIILTIAVLMSFSSVAPAQKSSKVFREGNRLYHNQEYNEAGLLYLKGLEADSTDVRGLYNFANTLYKQGEYDKSAAIYTKLLSDDKLNSIQKSNIFHNLGNIALQGEHYENGIKAYEEALKLNPDDADTRYNLEYALKKLRQRQNQQNNANSDQSKEDQKGDQDEENQQGNRSKELRQPQNQDKNEQEQDRGGQSGKMNKSDAERILNIIGNQEKDTLEKMKKNRVEQQIKTDKDW